MSGGDGNGGRGGLFFAVKKLLHHRSFFRSRGANRRRLQRQTAFRLSHRSPWLTIAKHPFPPSPSTRVPTAVASCSFTTNDDDLHSASCSFTTNDDDSSSTKTELMSIISPNGKFIRIITGWQKGQLLGRGSFGSVFQGIAHDGFFFAVEEVSLLDQGDDARQSIYQLEQEIACLSQFEHDNIVQYFGTGKDDSKLYIFFELVSQRSLLSLYQTYHLRDSQVSAYTRQILLGFDLMAM